MVFCGKCGKQISDSARFCSRCGVPVDRNPLENEHQRRQIYDGEIRKCPNCGELLNSFETTCSSCNYELRGINTSTAIAAFSKRLEEVEVESQENAAHGFFRSRKKRDDTKIADRKVEVIRTFAVPNTKEDIFEFLILATSNINTRIFATDSSLKGSIEAKKLDSEKALSDAWLAKVKQTYQKARLSFGNDPSFEQIQDIYNRCLNDVAKANRKRLTKIIFMIAFAVLIISFAPIYLLIDGCAFAP